MPKFDWGASFAISMSLAVLVGLPSVAAPGRSADKVVNELKVVKELQPALKELRASECPVYLPTWIPEWNKAKYTQVNVSPDMYLFPHGYEVVLGADKQVASCNTTFYVQGGVGRVSGKHPVKLTGGRTGYLKHALIQWNQGKYKYAIGFVTAKTTNADMIRCANSVVLVPKSK